MIKEWIENNLKGDPIIWAIVLALSVLSILVVYSATGTLAYAKMGGDTEYYLMKHSVLTILSLVAIWGAHKIDYRYYSKLSKLALWVSVPLLMITYLFGNTMNEASRWLTIPVINQAFQPSDLAKLALFVTIASILSKRQQSEEELKESLIPILLWCGVICGLIAMSNFSTAVLIFATCMLLMFIGRVPVKYLAMLVMIGALSGAVALTLGQRGQTVISRVQSFLSDDESALPFQAQQSYIAVASGGIVGKGPGQSDQRNFLPHPYSDFIYAIIIEEYGMIGGVTVILLYLALLYRGMIVFMQSERAYGGLLSAALSFALVMQAFINMGVAVGLGPITGLPLPLVSMGGTSQLFMGISIGIILSVSRGELDEFPSDVKGNGKRKVAAMA
ncbi:MULTISPECIES: FtsW/RodA/SpoVE family cell cycle protein [unclassified Imperialibacter]|uniref:FtsW/RodA/SpoVE family cell cycle protein n=1 Tax=unclassified Imperialibacter TaxID=2629706 RepID=UPI001257CEC9|nr:MULTISPECIES: FtsW/RodA/SpoVE family cell cycle protein [unclassified Imperialibacter]CAD5284880.1 Cell division protein FtsW [Imperialibacter sp. 75]CAD5296661.1 Cell division protein FtsW [Imperialibacter sp. 89]VVT24251.1 Cell division protein FtsW [Imperialibacter sp. EC-SDR9]